MAYPTQPYDDPYRQQGYAPRPLYDQPNPSAYSVDPHGEGEEKEYGVHEEEDEVRPLKDEYFAGGFRGQYPPAGGLTRRETSAEQWRQRQTTRLGRAQTKRVALGRQGNFIAEFAVPTAIKNANRNALARESDHPEELTHLRYTAATCDPDEFVRENGWSLRASNYGRETELLIAMTYYNEDKILVARTLHGLMTNVTDMVKSRYSEFRRMSKAGESGVATGDDSWKRIVVCLVFDGVEPADKASLDLLATLGIYQDGIMKSAVDGKDTVGHIFEYTTALSMSPKPQLITPSPGDPNSLVPVQMIFVLKQKNSKKINSHRWLFNAIGRFLQPNVCILLDAGTKPRAKSIYYLWEAFHHNANLGGACGEITAMLGKGGRKLLNPLVAAQNFEYKMSNVLDKPTESSFGYVSVLPGAFSAYRYAAIQGRPLEQYFHGDHTLAARLGAKGVLGMSIFKMNMFLAEDRILCFELAAKAKAQWVLGYVKPAKAETDVPEGAAELIGQRRRWLNGSFAAGIYSLVNFGRFYKSNHSVIRLFFFHIQALYNTVNTFMAWFQIGFFFLTFSIIIEIVATNLRFPDSVHLPDLDTTTPPSATRQCWSGSPFTNTTLLIDGQRTAPTTGFFHDHDFMGELNWALEVLYLALVALQVILALGNRPKGEKLTYAISFWIFAFLSLYLITNTVYLTIMAFCPLNATIAKNGGSVFKTLTGTTFGSIMAGILGTFGIYIISSIMYLDPWHILHSMPQYLLIAPSFTNILQTYSLANLHDVSWGTKGSDKADTLPTVETKKSDGKGPAVAEVAEAAQEDVDAAFEQTVKRAIAPFDPHEEVEKPTRDDENKTFRTRFFTVWLGSNVIVAVIISRSSTDVRGKFFVGLLFVTFGLAVVRFLCVDDCSGALNVGSGFAWYLLGESIFRLARLCGRARRR